MFAVRFFVLIIFASISLGDYHEGSFITIDSLMDLINGTSTVFTPTINKKVPPLLVPAEDVIRREGYPVEIHRFYTADGQMLTMHRIPSQSWRHSNDILRPKQPVLIMHGFLGSSQTWLQLPSNQGLPYLLADAGFDVWLGNFRTNYYSRSHIKYSTKDSRFWDISFHEMGLYDIPAMVDHILEVTGYQQIVYIGHSMGTSSFLVMSSSRPEYNPKILAAFLLSPVALTIRTTELQPLLGNFLFPNADFIYRSSKKLRSYEIFPRNEYLYNLLDTSCGPTRFQRLCLALIAQGYGEHRENINLNEFGRYAVSLIAGTSAKVANHLAQLFNTGEFRQFDYGPKGNQYRYGSTVPPAYPLERAKAPIYMYYGLNDVLMSTQAVNRLARALPNVIYVSAVEDPKFTHLDFLFGNNAKDVLYNLIIAQIKALQPLELQLNHYSS